MSTSRENERQNDNSLKNSKATAGIGHSLRVYSDRHVLGVTRDRLLLHTIRRKEDDSWTWTGFGDVKNRLAAHIFLYMSQVQKTFDNFLLFFRWL
jgi:hypothetical protein